MTSPGWRASARPSAASTVLPMPPEPCVTTAYQGPRSGSRLVCSRRSSDELPARVCARFGTIFCGLQTPAGSSRREGFGDAPTGLVGGGTGVRARSGPRTWHWSPFWCLVVERLTTDVTEQRAQLVYRTWGTSRGHLHATSCGSGLPDEIPSFKSGGDKPRGEPEIAFRRSQDGLAALGGGGLPRRMVCVTTAGGSGYGARP